MSGRVALALDTSTEVTVVALGRVTETWTAVMDCEEVAAPRAAMSKLLPLVQEVLDRNRYSLDEVEEVLVGRGPGSFTGVRIGVATAKGLAQGLGVPLYGVGTLDSIAWRFSGRDTLLGVVGDAMRGEVYPALFKCGEGKVERLSEDSVMHPVQAAELWADHRGQILLAGNGLAKYGAVFSEVFGEDALTGPDQWAPSGHGLLLSGRIGSGDPGTLLPVYTRLSDAEENERRGPTRARLPGSGVAGESP